MGPFHGKLVVHRPTGTLGIASSRRNPTTERDQESWDYSIRCADRSQTRFFPQWELRLANSVQKSMFQEIRRKLSPLRGRTTPQIASGQVGSSVEPTQDQGNAGSSRGADKID